MAGTALRIGNLGQIYVICASGEVHVVVAGPACCLARIEIVGFGIGRAGGLVMADFAALRHGRECDTRKVANGVLITDDLVFAARDHARQARSHVDLVDHYLEIY